MLKKITAAFIESAAELKNLKTYTACALLGAISMILGYLSIQIGPSMKITFASVPIELASGVFGPVVGPVLGVTMDLVNYYIKPTGPFFPGFTISAVVMTIIIGIGLYKKPISLKRILISTFIVVVVVDMCMNTFWLSILYHQAVLVLLPLRVLKCLILWPIQAGMLYVLLKALKSAGFVHKVKEEN